MMYFLDTNICIYHINDTAPKMSDKLESIPIGQIKIPSMVVAELMYGAEKSERRYDNIRRYRAFLSLFDIAVFDNKSAMHYGNIRAELERKGLLIGGNDMVIAAIVRANAGFLVTNNTREFSRVGGLKLEDWTQ